MRKQQKYKVIASKKLSELSQEVEDAMKEGWECMGGVCAADMSPKSFHNVDLAYHQSMVMYSATETDNEHRICFSVGRKRTGLGCAS